jgi:RNA polymerase subunit RPABC4/transcription elongation factor Spt4
MQADLDQFCTSCKEVVACYEDEPEICPFCGLSTMDISEAVDAAQESPLED